VAIRITVWSGYGDCFLPDSSLLGDTESGVNRLRCATLQFTAYTSRHRHSKDDVIVTPAYDRQPRQTCLGGGMHCPSTSGYIYSFFGSVRQIQLATRQLLGTHDHRLLNVCLVKIYDKLSYIVSYGQLLVLDESLSVLLDAS